MTSASNAGNGLIYIADGNQQPLVYESRNKPTQRQQTEALLTAAARVAMQTAEVSRYFRQKIRLCGALPSGKGSGWPVGLWDRIETHARAIFFAEDFPAFILGIRAQAPDAVLTEGAIREYLCWWAGCLAFLKIAEEISSQPLTPIVYCSTITTESRQPETPNRKEGAK